MEIRYDPQADVLLVKVRSDPPIDAVEEPGGVISYGGDGEPVSVEFLHASKRPLVRLDEVREAETHEEKPGICSDVARFSTGAGR